MLALAAYVRSVRRPGRGWAVLVALSLWLGLMAKQVLVTLPFLLLLLDVWPLGRHVRGGRQRSAGLAKLVVEKTPLFLIAGAGMWVAWYAQRRGGATIMLELPLAVRLENAVVSCARYLGKAFWPAPTWPSPGTTSVARALPATNGPPRSRRSGGPSP